MTDTRTNDPRVTDARMGPRRPTTSLAGDIAADLTSIANKEIRLARAEMTQNIRDAGRGLASLIGALAVLIPGVTVLLLAIGYLIVAVFGIDRWIAFLIVSVVFILFGLIMVDRAKSALDPENLTPSRTAKNLERDAQLVKETVR